MWSDLFGDAAMRFDLITGVISPPLYAPLALMVGGFLLALVGFIFLLLRRRNGGKPASKSTASASAARQASTPASAEQNPIDDTPAETPAAPMGRRRSLVGGAERDEGTPTGVTAKEEDTEDFDPQGINDEETQLEEVDETSAPEDFTADIQATHEPDFDAEPEYEAAPDLADDETAFLEENAPDDEIDAAWIDHTSEDDEGTDDILSGAGIAITAAGAAGTVGAAAILDNLEPEVEPVDEPIEPIEPNEPNENASSNSAVIGPPNSPEVAASRIRPIVFRQFLPQSPGKDGLSFYGGQPIGPDEFQWPRERGAQGGAPLQFLMQWDCTQLSEQDPTGLLPQDGVLYCFVNCDRDDEEDFLSSHAFVHYRGSVRAWRPIDIPEDAGPALGKTASLKLSGCTDQVQNADAFVPRVMPRFPFAPIAIEHSALDGDEAGYWSDDAAAQALLDTQKSGVAVRASASKAGDLQDEMARPFLSFPHDFGAIRVIASRMLETLQDPDPLLAETLYPGLSAEEREAQFNGWCEEAKELYLLGTQRPEGHRLEPNISDDIWKWFDQRRSLQGTDLTAIVQETVDLSLSVSSEALGNVPAEWIDKAMDTHALAREYETDEGLRSHAPTPARMFGPPSKGASAIAHLAPDHLLLLELPSGSGPQHFFGGKVLQYWITPDDLAAGKFEKAKCVVIEA